MDNEAISFEGRFGGVAHSLNVPSAAVIMAIYARENGQGMVFEIEPTQRTMTRRAMLVALQEERAATGRSPESEGREVMRRPVIGAADRSVDILEQLDDPLYPGDALTRLSRGCLPGV